jgi:hypothetical protein
MSAAIVAFPARRRVGFIRRHALRMSTLSERAAGRYLAQQLRIRAETLARRGIARDRVSREITQLEAEIRRHLSRLSALGVA